MGGFSYIRTCVSAHAGEREREGGFVLLPPERNLDVGRGGVGTQSSVVIEQNGLLQLAVHDHTQAEGDCY